MLDEIERVSGIERPTEDDLSAPTRKKENLVQYLLPVHPAVHARTNMHDVAISISD